VVRTEWLSYVGAGNAAASCVTDCPKQQPLRKCLVTWNSPTTEVCSQAPNPVATKNDCLCPQLSGKKLLLTQDDVCGAPHSSAPSLQLLSARGRAMEKDELRSSASFGSMCPMPDV
jgi:hypothetical protein